jgi:DNA primase
MYNVDELFRYSSEPIFITEGIFDSIPLNGVALMGSSLNEAKLAILKKSRRRLIFVIDKNANGQHVATTAMAAGFEITFSPGDDVNSSIGDYGLLWTIRTLLQRARTPGIRAELDVKTNCR